MAESTEVARRERESTVITTPDEYLDKMRKWTELHYNVLTPFTNMNGIAPSHGLYVGTTRISMDPRDEESYSGYNPKTGAKAMPFLGGERGAPNEEFAIAKRGLRKLAELAGISIIRVDRVDGHKFEHYWEFQAEAEYTGLDGNKTRRIASQVWDLRDGSTRMTGWQPNQVVEGRKNGYRACESRAINAVIRECGAGIKQKYTRAELDKPFVVVRVSFQPDLTDPAIKRIVTEQALDSRRMFYTREPQALPAPAIDAEAVPERTRETVPAGVGTAPAATTSRATSNAPASSPADAPPNTHAVKIREVKIAAGETNGRKWTRYTVIDSRGVEASTFSKTDYEQALKFKAEDAWVEIVTERQNGHSNIIEIIRAQADLPGLDEV